MTVNVDISAPVQKILDRFFPDKGVQKYIWFAILWFFGLISVFLLAAMVRLIFMIGGQM